MSQQSLTGSFTLEQMVARDLARQLGRTPTHAEVGRAIATLTRRPQSAQMRAALAGKPVRPLPTARQRQVKRKVRKAKKVVNIWLAGIGLLMVVLAIFMALGAGIGTALN